MKTIGWIFAFILLLGIECLLGYRLYRLVTPAKQEFVAWLRVKDEIKTIGACLDSIDGIFDRIVIIHSNEPDDGSIAFMRDWCAKRSYCEIHEYPHAVIPAHDARLKEKYDSKNSLAAYYNFGLTFLKPEDWVIKIDGDQVYIPTELRKTIKRIKNITKTGKDSYLFGIKGYNTFAYNNRLVKYKHQPFNGGLDSFIIKRKYIRHFTQLQFHENLKVQDGVKNIILPNKHWFHFMKSLKSGGKTTPLSDVTQDQTTPLTIEETQLYHQVIQPLLRQNGSLYQNLIVP